MYRPRVMALGRASSPRCRPTMPMSAVAGTGVTASRWDSTARVADLPRAVLPRAVLRDRDSGTGWVAAWSVGGGRSVELGDDGSGEFVGVDGPVGDVRLGCRVDQGC